MFKKNGTGRWMQRLPDGKLRKYIDVAHRANVVRRRTEGGRRQQLALLAAHNKAEREKKLLAKRTARAKVAQVGLAPLQLGTRHSTLGSYIRHSAPPLHSALGTRHLRHTLLTCTARPAGEGSALGAEPACFQVHRDPGHDRDGAQGSAQHSQEDRRAQGRAAHTAEGDRGQGKPPATVRMGVPWG